MGNVTQSMTTTLELNNYNPDSRLFWNTRNNFNDLNAVIEHPLSYYGRHPSGFEPVVNEALEYCQWIYEDMGIEDMPTNIREVTPDQARRLASCIIVDGRPLSESPEFQNLDTDLNAQAATISMALMTWQAVNPIKSREGLDVQFYNPVANEKINVDTTPVFDAIKETIPPVKVPWWKKALNTLFGAFKDDIAKQREYEEKISALDARHAQISAQNDKTFEEKPKTMAEWMGVKNPVHAAEINRIHEEDPLKTPDEIRKDLEGINFNSVEYAKDPDTWYTSMVSEAAASAKESMDKLSQMPKEERSAYVKQMLDDAKNIMKDASINSPAYKSQVEDYVNNLNLDDKTKQNVVKFFTTKFIPDFSKLDGTMDQDKFIENQRQDELAGILGLESEIVVDLDKLGDDGDLDKAADDMRQKRNEKATRILTTFAKEEAEQRRETGTDPIKLTQKPLENEASKSNSMSGPSK